MGRIIQLMVYKDVLLALTEDGEVYEWNPNINEFTQWGKK